MTRVLDPHSHRAAITVLPSVHPPVLLVSGIRTTIYDSKKSAYLSERGEALLQVADNRNTAEMMMSHSFTTETIPAWYALSTAPRHEKRVASFLSHRQVEHFLPLYKTVHRWKNGVKAQLELPLFPGYLFVKINKNRRVQVLDAPGVITLVGPRSGPAELSETEIETMRTGLHLRNVKPFRELVVGQRVRVKAGALAGLCGILMRTASGVRMVITVELINQSVAVELDAQDLEPADTRSSPRILATAHS